MAQTKSVKNITRETKEDLRKKGVNLWAKKIQQDPTPEEAAQKEFIRFLDKILNDQDNNTKTNLSILKAIAQKLNTIRDNINVSVDIPENNNQKVKGFVVERDSTGKIKYIRVDNE